MNIHSKFFILVASQNHLISLVNLTFFYLLIHFIKEGSSGGAIFSGASERRQLLHKRRLVARSVQLLIAHLVHQDKNYVPSVFAQ
jgi:hypothetical protein